MARLPIVKPFEGMDRANNGVFDLATILHTLSSSAHEFPGTPVFMLVNGERYSIDSISFSVSENAVLLRAKE